LKTAFTRKFQKQLDNCKDKHVRKKVVAAIEKAQTAESIKSIPHIKKLRGTKNAYRIRIGDYRIGLLTDTNSVIFASFDHRSEIYKYFP